MAAVLLMRRVGVQIAPSLMLSATTLSTIAVRVNDPAMADSGSYHHGDLRAALLRVADIEIERTGYEGLSLRRLAGLAGVSYGAPYRHFETREALLFELALGGARMLEAAYQAAAQGDDGPTRRLKGICRAYIALAHDRPQLFRLMFVSEILKTAPFKGAWAKALEGPFQAFRQALAGALRDERKADIDTVTLSCWATIHGLALLRMTGRLDRFEENPDAAAMLVESVLDDMLGRL